jgi:hypothetical protein
VASQLEISNGHAARMRFSRFRQHMEGIPTVSRTARPKKPSKSECSKLDKLKGDFDKGHSNPPMDGNLKKRPAPADFIKEERREPLTSFVKREPAPDPTLSTLPPAMPPSGLVPASGNSLSTTAPPPLPYPMFGTIAPADLTRNPTPHYHHDPSPCQPQYPPTPSLYPHISVSMNPFGGISPVRSQPPPQHLWAPVKVEPNDGGSLDDIFVKVEPSMG